MNLLSIFLIIIILACICFGMQPTRESFIAKCRTLRCEQNQYSATSLKNTATNHLTTLSSGHIDTIKNHLSNFRQQWL